MQCIIIKYQSRAPSSKRSSLQEESLPKTQLQCIALIRDCHSTIDPPISLDEAYKLLAHPTYISVPIEAWATHQILHTTFRLAWYLYITRYCTQLSGRQQFQSASQFSRQLHIQSTRRLFSTQLYNAGLTRCSFPYAGNNFKSLEPQRIFRYTQRSRLQHTAPRCIRVAQLSFQSQHSKYISQ